MQTMQVGVEDRSGHVAQQVVFVILQHRLQCIALKENAALELAQSCAGGAGSMTYGRARLVEDAIACQPGAPSEIDVLEVREIIVVEAVQRQERLAAGRSEERRVGKECRSR